jgi:formylglycine-generating enzyme required for sulfatase activity
LVYRLPRDTEWSWLVGVTNETVKALAEVDDALAPTARFYWGTNWPPPAKYGNFAGSESPFGERLCIAGYADAFRTAAPVGSFRAEQHGLRDLAGNVAELCEAWPPSGDLSFPFVRRGAAWDSYKPKAFDVRYARPVRLHEASVGAGFRVVRAPVETSAPAN